MKDQDILDYRIRLGITQGDINGVGYEIIIKALSDARMLDFFTPIIYGSSKVASYHKKILNNQEINFNLIKKAELANPKRINIINVFEEEIKIEIGNPTPVAGEQALLALESAYNDLRNNHIDVLVTAPINKKTMQSTNFKAPGHTEYLASFYPNTEPLMLLISNQVRIGIVTGHIPLKDVSSSITTELILKKINIMNQTLLQDFSIRKPKIAVLGINPHAGDSGAIGNEDMQIIMPAIEQACKQNMLVYGPFAADGFFGTSAFKKFDGILAMYHDQGLIPFKTLAFDTGVNFTAGLPIIRTSPAHGTAYDIAGQNIASDESFRSALFAACDIFRNRAIHKKITANPLKSTHSNKEEDN